MYNINGV